MDNPNDQLGTDRPVTSSEKSCEDHIIHWEASIKGEITTEPNAGTLPIKNVTVSWELLDENKEPINCVGCDTEEGCGGCRGSTTTREGGSFDIEINLDNAALHYKNRAFLKKSSFFLKFYFKYSNITTNITINTLTIARFFNENRSSISGKNHIYQADRTTNGDVSSPILASR